MRRRSLTELAHIAELVWSWRLSRWVERLRQDQERVRQARQSRAPTVPAAAALWQRFAHERDERIAELERLVRESSRGVAAARRRLGIARARRHAASRAVRRYQARVTADPAGDELEAWVVRKALQETAQRTVRQGD